MYQLNAIINDALKVHDTIFTAVYKRNLLNFRHHFHFGVYHLKSVHFIILQIKH